MGLTYNRVWTCLNVVLNPVTDSCVNYSNLVVTLCLCAESDSDKACHKGRARWREEATGRDTEWGLKVSVERLSPKGLSSTHSISLTVSSIIYGTLNKLTTVHAVNKQNLTLTLYHFANVKWKYEFNWPLHTIRNYWIIFTNEQWWLEIVGQQFGSCLKGVCVMRL